MTFVRYQSARPGRHGLHVGVFGLVNVLGRHGMLSVEDEALRREGNAWFDAAYLDPSTVDAAVYDRAVNPGASAWFKVATTEHLLARLPPYLAILDRHGVQWERVTSEDPGRVVYEDEHQVVVVPRGSSG